MDPSAVALVVSYLFGGAAIWAAYKLPRRTRVEQPSEEVQAQLKAQYQRDPSVPPTDARVAPSPLNAISTCPNPRCDWFGWHEWIEPDPERQTETVSEWYWDPGTEGESVTTWGGVLYRSTESRPAGWRLDRKRVGLEERLLEVVRVCPRCETRWGATPSGKVVW